MEHVNCMCHVDLNVLLASLQKDACLGTEDLTECFLMPFWVLLGGI